MCVSKCTACLALPRGNSVKTMNIGTRAGIAKWAECERTVGFAEAGGKG